jgi:hypothetical protein
MCGGLISATLIDPHGQTNQPHALRAELMTFDDDKAGLMGSLVLAVPFDDQLLEPPRSTGTCFSQGLDCAHAALAASGATFLHQAVSSPLVGCHETMQVASVMSVLLRS